MDRSTLVRVIRPVGLLVLLAALLLPVLPAQIVRAATVTVTANSADVIHNPGCANDGTTAPCSLRDAVLYANAHTGTVISIPAGTYTLTLPSTCTNNDATCGDLNTINDTTILGAGAASTIIQARTTDNSAGIIDRLFHVAGGTLTVRGVTIRNGRVATDGGGILIDADDSLDIADSVVSGNASGGTGSGITFVGGAGHLTLTNTTVSGNTLNAASVGFGGGIYFAGGTATITNSTISSNTTMGTSAGGGIQVDGGAMTITNTTISNNTSPFGGGVSIAASASLSVNASAITGNSAAVRGGGIENLGVLSVTNTTVSGNTANGDSGGGIDSRNQGGSPTLSVTQSTIANNTSTRTGGGIAGNTPMTISGSIVAGNSGTSTTGSLGCPGAIDVCGAFTSSGYNFIGQTDGSTGFGGTDLTGTAASPRNPRLGPLQYNGGPTQTMAPVLNSPAVDAIPPANCGVTTDQTGTPRPQGTKCDIGAVELLLPSLALNPASGAPGTTVTFSGAGFRTGLSLVIGGSASATIGTVAADGTSFTATIPSPHASGTVSMTVTNPDTTEVGAAFTYTSATLTSIAVIPANPSIPKGTTQQFTATGTYSDTTTADITNSVTWQSATGTVATIANSVGSKGLATGVGTGTSTISATSGAVSGSTTLSVTAAVLTSIAVTPANPQIAKGTTQQFTATGTFSDGSTQNLTATVTWVSSNAGVAANPPDGLATGAAAGTTTISATSGAVSGSTSLAVTDAALVSIAVTPANPVIAKGATQQLIATGTYSDNTTADITTAVTWQSASDSVATISNTAGTKGVATGVDIGTITITATLGSVTSPNVVLVVTAPTLTSIAVTPANPVIAKGTTQQFTATGAFSDGSTQDLTASVTWASSNAGVAATPSGGLATGIAAGTTTISATSNGVSGSTNLAVTDATLVSIAVTPGSPAIAKGTTQQFTATGTFSDGSTQDLTSSATWSATGGTGSATISNAAGTKGRATGVAPGTGITIAAASGGTSGSATLAVTAATLTSIAITPGGASVPRGLTQQFTATGTFSDGTTQDLTATATWASSNTGAVANPPNGLATGSHVGTATITASQASVTSPGVIFTVTNATLTSIAVSPTSPSIAKGTNTQFTATGTYSDASTANLTSSVLWQSSDPTKATIDASGQATGVATGGTTITATVSGVTSNNATLTVTAATLTSIAVTPANPTIAKGTTRQFTATGTFSDGTTQDLIADPALTWQSGTPGVATVASSGATKGQATAVAPGTAQITAMRGSVSGGTTLTVTNASLTSIAVTPATAGVTKGATQPFTAIGTYSDGTTADLTSSVTWASSTPGVAAIGNAVGSHGLATAVTPGTTTITATQGNVTSNGATLTVTASKTLTSIATTPASPSVKVGATVQLTATGTYSDNTTADLTGQVQWSTSDANVASVDAAGKVTGKSAGTVTITAMVSGVAGQTQVTVGAGSGVGINPAPAPAPRGTGAGVGAGGSGNPPAPAPTGR